MGPRARCATAFDAQPNTPNQNVYIQCFNRGQHDDCLNEHWIPALLHARAEIEI